MFAKVRIRRVSVSTRPIECGGCKVKGNALTMYRDFILPGRYHRGCLPLYIGNAVEFRVARSR